MRCEHDSCRRRVLSLILAVMVVAVGFCLFDGDEHGSGHHPGFDLCLGMLATLITVTLVSRFRLLGLAATQYVAFASEFSMRVPAPPPKSVLS